MPRRKVAGLLPVSCCGASAEVVVAPGTAEATPQELAQEEQACIEGIALLQSYRRWVSLPKRLAAAQERLGIKSELLNVK